MDVVSGLINVLTGQRFTGRSHEGVHKSAPDIYSVSKTGVTLVWFPHSAAVCIAGWIRATRRSTTRYSPLPARIQIDGKASQSLCAHEFITEHNGMRRQRGMGKKKKNTAEVKVKPICGAFQRNTSLSAAQSNKWLKQCRFRRIKTLLGLPRADPNSILFHATT